MSDCITLAGLRVLVVEDEMLVSLMIEELLTEQRCSVIGPFDRLDRALHAAQSSSFDLALLDVNIAGDKIYPVAEAVARRGIPFLLLSGYGEAAIPPEHPEWRACAKPFRATDLIRMLTEQVADDH
jgi:DNA-binding NarL/FixJ family response regulator